MKISNLLIISTFVFTGATFGAENVICKLIRHNGNALSQSSIRATLDLNRNKTLQNKQGKNYSQNDKVSLTILDDKFNDSSDFVTIRVSSKETTDRIILSKKTLFNSPAGASFGMETAAGSGLVVCYTMKNNKKAPFDDGYRALKNANPEGEKASKNCASSVSNSNLKNASAYFNFNSIYPQSSLGPQFAMPSSMGR